MYTELDHVKTALRLLGERPVNSLDTPHPRVASIRAALQEASIDAQSQNGGWWFNTEYPMLSPMTDGTIALPNDTLTVDGLSPAPSLVQRGRFLYNATDATNIFSSAVRVRLVRFIEFENLPVEARMFISAKALVDVLVGLDADGSKREVANQKMQRAYVNLHAQHIRSLQGSMLETPSMSVHMNNIAGLPGVLSIGGRL